jgi:hypothetical protein
MLRGFPAGWWLSRTTLWTRLWWRFMPGAVIHVRWPGGHDHWFEGDGAHAVNEHYRPELERRVGRQGIHWNWGVSEDHTLAIKIIKTKAAHASLFAIMWS